MNDLPLHPVLVHLPIALAVILPPATALTLLAWVRGWLPRRAWFGVVALQATLLLSGFLASRTGEADEERVERVVPEARIEAHEEAAEQFLWVAGVVLLLAAGTAMAKSERLGRSLAVVTLLGTLAVAWAGYRVGHAGGALVYRHGAAQVFVDAAAQGQPLGGSLWSGEGEHDDDDD